MALPRLPKSQALFENRPNASATIEQLFEAGEGNTGSDARILLASSETAQLFLFILHHSPYAAGRLEAGGFQALSIRGFFTGLSDLPGARLSLYAANPLLFKCCIVLMQKSPTASGSTDVLNIEPLLARLKASGREAIVTLQRGQQWNLFYIAKGELHEGFFVDPGAVSTDATPEEQFLEYGYKASTAMPVQIAAYEDTATAPAEDADSAWDESPTGIMAYFLRPRPVLTLARDGQSGQTVTIKGRLFRIGRDPGCDFAIQDTSASREHAVIRELGGRFVLEDCGSRNGTFLNGERIEAAAPLTNGDEFVISSYRFRFSEKSAEAQRRPAAASVDQLETTVLRLDDAILSAAEQALAKPAAPRELRLEIMTGEQRGIIFNLGPKTVIGRTRSDISTNDPKVSRRHAVIERRAEGYFFCDLNSTNGSFVNDEPARERKLAAGDLIRVGDTELKVLPGA